MIDIVISIDLEFDINNAFSGKQSRPMGQDSVRSPAHPGYGLDAILDPIEAHGMRAVFFTETLNCHYFGSNEMGDIASELHERGHELQLHLHPVWTLFRDDDWRSQQANENIRSDQHDNFAARTDDEAGDLLRQGLQQFEQWKLPRPIAFRTGNLRMARSHYPVLARHGFKLSSSVGRNGFEGESPVPPEPIAEWDGVLEVPVTRYHELEAINVSRPRLFTLTGSSCVALQNIPQLAYQQNVSPLMLLTHAAEFMPETTGRGIARVNKQKLSDFCAMLASNTDKFRVTTVNDGIDRWRSHQSIQPVRVPLWKGIHSIVDRVIELKVRAA